MGTSNDWSSEGGSEEVDVLVDGIALNGWEAKLLDELIVELFDVALLRTNL